MTTYIDASARVAVYVTERFSKAARRALRAVPQVPYTQIHELEVPNAFELLVGRAVMTREGGRTIRVQLHDDIEHQRLVRLSLDLDRVFGDAYELSRLYASKFLSRSLDCFTLRQRASRRARHSSPPMIVNWRWRRRQAGGHRHQAPCSAHDALSIARRARIDARGSR